MGVPNRCHEMALITAPRRISLSERAVLLSKAMYHRVGASMAGLQYCSAPLGTIGAQITALIHFLGTMVW